MADSQSSTSSQPTPLTPPTSSPSKSIRPSKGSKVKSNIPTLKKPAQLVTLYAGQSKEKFVVHREFACRYSPVLDAAFKSDFVEGQTQEYRFEDTSEDAVRLLVHWFYTQVRILSTLQSWLTARWKEITRKRRVKTWLLLISYRKTATDSPLRRYFVDDCGARLGSTLYKELTDRFPPEMLIDLVTALSDSKVRKAMAPKHDMTRYYVLEN
ncbi:hypothetical protein DL98DRAFT_568007 [Cadophora sp. DSE1049]|nr:hypothetical protein DL98DRAFT_568007 [Cadophora sp. DSE1049]